MKGTVFGMGFLKQMVLACYKILTKILPINKKIILFESNLGRNYTGNPRRFMRKWLPGDWIKSTAVILYWKICRLKYRDRLRKLKETGSGIFIILPRQGYG